MLMNRKTCLIPILLLLLLTHQNAGLSLLSCFTFSSISLPPLTMNLAVSSIAVVITGSAGAETRSSLSVPCPFLVPQIFSIYFKFKASFFDKRSSIQLLIYIYSKTLFKQPLKKTTKTDYSLMQVFCNPFNFH